MSTSPSNPPPSTITGGCLCGSIRYTIAIPNSSTWPPTAGTCQCTMCRKFTGSLIYNWMQVPTSSVTPPLTSSPLYKIYNSSEKGYRGFCSNCGSSLTYGERDNEDETELMIGTIDEEFLCGKKIESSSHGESPCKREGGWPEIAKGIRHCYYENAVKGVSDNIVGNKYWKGRLDGEPFQ